MPLSGEQIELLFNCLPGFGARLDKRLFSTLSLSERLGALRIYIFSQC
jgi:hypothetical protein